MLFLKQARFFHKNILFDLASFIVSVIMLGPLIDAVNVPLFEHQDKFIEKIIKTQISDFFPEYIVEVENVEVTSFFSVIPIEVKIENMSIIGPKVNFIVPESKLKFGIESIFFSGIPEAVNISGLKIIVDNITTERGLVTLYEAKDLNKFISEIISDLSETLSVINFPKKTQVMLDEFQIVDQRNLESDKIIISAASFNAFISQQNKLKAVLSVETSDIGKIDFSLDASLTDVVWKATANMQSVDVRTFRAYLPKVVREILLEGFISGELNAEFEGTNLTSADGHFDSKKIKINAQFEDNLNPLQFSGWFDYDASENSAVFSNLVLILEPELKLKAAIQLDNIGSSNTQIIATAETRDTPLKVILPYLSSQPLLLLKDVITQHSSGGAVDFASVELSAVKEANKDKIHWHKLQIDGQLSNVQIKATSQQYNILTAKTKSVFSVNLDNNNSKRNKFLLSSTLSDGLIELANSERVVSNISGKLDFSFDENTIQNASIKFLQPEMGEVLFTAEFPKLEEATARFGERTYKEFKTNFVGSKDSILGAISLETEKFDADLLLELWPEQLGTSARKWLSMRGNGGEFRNAKLRAFAEMPPFKSGISSFQSALKKARIAGISGVWGWHDFNFTWKEGSPLVQSVNLEARIFENHLSMEILDAEMPNLKMRNGQIELFPVLGYGDSNLKRAVEIDVAIDGSIPAFKELLNDPTINKLPVELKKITNPSGTIIAKIATVSELQNKKLKLNSISGVASLASASFENLPMKETLSGGKIELTLEKNGTIFFNGTGEISGVTSSFSGQQTADKNLSILVKTAASENFSQKIKEFTNVDISGNSAMRLHLNYASDTKLGIGNITADLTDAAIDLPVFNWVKIPGEIGKVDASFHFSPNSVTKMEIEDATVGTLQGKGSFEISTDLSTYRALLVDFKFPGYDIDKLVVTVNKNKTMKVFAEGGLIDTTFLRRTKGVIKNKEISFDFSSARLQLAEDITLQGRLIGDIDRTGSGVAILNGTLLHEQSPLIEEATIEATFNEQTETLTGTGLIGGVEATLLYESLANDTSYLLIKSQNAGRTLIGLDVLDTIRGGELILKNVYQKKEFDNFKTEIKVTDFSVIEAPKSVRALSVLSVTGLYSLIEGDGTKFDVGIANIETAGDRRILKNVQASGEAIKFELAGEYDRETDELQVRGILAPLSLLSDIIGVIPLVSNIVTGKDKTGFLATQFEMSGKLSNPVTTINPASVLAPGVLRDILSPDWLTRESGIRIDTQ